MNRILSEKDYQHFIMDYLKDNNGYIVRKDSDFNRLYSMDTELLFQFLNDTQPDEMDKLRHIYKSDLEENINQEMNKKSNNFLHVLKQGLNFVSDIKEQI